MENIKNIIIYYPSFERGGVEKIIQNLIFFFIKKKIKIYLITTNKKNLGPIKKFKNLSIIYGKTSAFNNLFPKRFSTMMSCIKPLINLLKKLDNNQTVIHSMQSSYLPIIISKFSNFKIVIRNSEDPISSIKFADEKFYSYIVFILRFFFYNLADFIITNSKGSANSLKFFLFGKNKNKVKYIYNPYLTKKKIVNSYNKLNRENIILSVGRLCKQKNFENLILAFKKFNKKNSKYKLNIIGDGYNKEKLKKLIRSEKLENKVLLKGYLSNIEKEYKKSKLFILPSLYEGLGNVLIDAINFSVPCIVTNCKSGPSEIISHGRGGTLVPVNDINKMSEAIEYNLSNYSIIKKKLLYAQKKLYRFDSEKQSMKYLLTLANVLR